MPTVIPTGVSSLLRAPSEKIVRRYAIVSALVLIWVAFVYILGTRVFISEETKVKKQIERGRKALQNESFLTISSLIDVDYRDRDGRTREELLAAVRSFFQQADDLDIKIISERVMVEDSHAEAYVRFTVSATIDGVRFQSIDREGYSEIWLRLSKKQGSWKLVESKWTGVENR